VTREGAIFNFVTKAGRTTTKQSQNFYSKSKI